MRSAHSPRTPDGWSRSAASSRRYVSDTLQLSPPDLVLITGMASGDEQAAATLYDRHSSVMFALALRIVGERADAEEVVLEAFMQAWRGAAAYDVSRGAVRSWLAMMTRTRALDLVRGRGREAKAVARAAHLFVDEPVAMSSAPPHAEEEVERSARATALVSALDVLAPSQRTAIELAFFEGLSHSEIAKRLAEPLGTVKTRIRLGMAKLRDALRNLAPETVA
jgi:RNA polymerase sigma-70 factor (ECF subfamily)